MATYVYRTSDGALFSWNQNDADPVASAQTLAAQGLTSVSGLPSLDATHAWVPAQQTVVVVAAVLPPNSIPLFDFYNAFTAAELAAIRASSDANIQQFLFANQGGTINLNNAKVTQALTYLVTKGLLTAPRATAIAATVAS